ncbi:MAG TPA: hypothetical protein VLX92_03520 [Kofleriaceae bacterium]|nr:hypothetical protein [Kofleriaceae bacterium]
MRVSVGVAAWAVTSAACGHARPTVASPVTRHFATRVGAPMWCGEFGENSTDAVREQLALFDRTKGVTGWAFWTWKKVKNRHPALHEIVTTPSWRATIDWVVHH